MDRAGAVRVPCRQKGGKTLARNCHEIPGPGPILEHGLAQNDAHLLFRREAVLRGAGAQALPQVVIQIADGNTLHRPVLPTELEVHSQSYAFSADHHERCETVPWRRGHAYGDDQVCLSGRLSMSSTARCKTASVEQPFRLNGHKAGTSRGQKSSSS